MYGLEDIKPKVGTKLKAVDYERVSTPGQVINGHSMEVQKKMFTALVEQHAIEVLKTFEDPGRSARDLNRRDIEELMDFCDDNAAVLDVVFVQDTSRLCRNVQDHLALKAFLKKRDIRLIPLDGYFGEGDEAEFADVVVAAINQLESRRTAKKTKRVMKALAEKGIKPGMSGIGYMNSYQKDKPIYPDPERIPFIYDIYKLWLTGNYSVACIADTEFEKGFRTKSGGKVQKNTITNILKNILYAGGLKYDGVEYEKAAHEAIVPPDWYNRSLAMFEKKNKGANRNRKHTTLLAGYCYCLKCGRQMAAEYHPRANYYSCGSCEKTNVPLEKVDKKVRAFFHGTVFSEKALENLRNVLYEVKAEQGISVPEQLKTLRQRRDILDKKMKQLEDKMFGGDDLVDSERLKERYKPLKEELKQVDEQIAQMDKPSTTLKDSEIEKIIKGMKNIGELYDAMTKVQQKQFLRFFIAKAFLEKERLITSFEYVPEFKALISRDLVRIKSNWLPLVDMFCNHKIDLSYVSVPSLEMLVGVNST